MERGKSLKETLVTHWTQADDPQGINTYLSYGNRMIKFHFDPRKNANCHWTLVEQPVRLKMALILMGDMKRERDVVRRFVTPERVIKLLRIRRKNGHSKRS